MKQKYIWNMINSSANTVKPGVSKLFGKRKKVYYRQVVYYLAGDLCWKWDFGKHKMFTNARLFTICKFTNTRFDCIAFLLNYLLWMSSNYFSTSQTLNLPPCLDLSNQHYDICIRRASGNIQFIFKCD